MVKRIRGLNRQLHEASFWMEDRSSKSIAIRGPGGTGKTTLMKLLNQKFLKTKQFDILIWVTLSSKLSIEKLPDDIAKIIGLFDVQWVDKIFKEKAEIIHEQLSLKKFALFLDDIWSPLDLRELGVPYLEEILPNQSKVIFTTRSKDVCKLMFVQHVVELEARSMNESWILFWDNFEFEADSMDQRIFYLARSFINKCQGLPILICTLGRAMTGRKTYEEWVHALNKIEMAETEKPGMNTDILFNFCLDSLRDDRIKSCLSYFSLFPEDFTIRKNDLIDFWICEQLFGTNNDAVNVGYNFVNALIQAGLLEEENDIFVKLQDMIRDFALLVAFESQMFKNARFLELIDIEKLEKSVGWIATTGDAIQNVAVVSEKLFTFLLNKNPFIMIKGDFSQFMNGLTVLDLSNSGVEEVPKEISKLISLHNLNLSHTWIERLPVELKELTKLKCLNLEHDEQLRVVPKELISSLSQLQVLKIFRCGYSVEVEEDNILLVRNMDLDSLLHLEHLEVLSITITCVSAMNKLLDNPRLLSCIQSLSLEVFWGTKSINISTLTTMKNLITLEIHQVENLETVNLQYCSKIMLANKCFERLLEVTLENCFNLQEVTWVIVAPKLKVLRVKNCEQMEEIVNNGQLDQILEGIEEWKLFDKLEILSLEYLPELKSIYLRALPCHHLRRIKVIDCPLLKKLPLSSKSGDLNEMVIEAEGNWWKNVEWENDVIKGIFQPCFAQLFD